MNSGKKTSSISTSTLEQQRLDFDKCIQSVEFLLSELRICEWTAPERAGMFVSFTLAVSLLRRRLLAKQYAEVIEDVHALIFDGLSPSEKKKLRAFFLRASPCYFREKLAAPGTSRERGKKRGCNVK